MIQALRILLAASLFTVLIVGLAYGQSVGHPDKLVESVLARNLEAAKRLANIKFNYARELTRPEPTASVTREFGQYIRKGELVWCSRTIPVEATGSDHPKTFVTITNDKLAAIAEELTPDVRVFEFDATHPLSREHFQSVSGHRPRDLVSTCSLEQESWHDPSALRFQLKQEPDADIVTLRIERVRKPDQERKPAYYECRLKKSYDFLPLSIVLWVDGKWSSRTQIDYVESPTGTVHPSRILHSLNSSDGSHERLRDDVHLLQVELNPSLPSDQFELSRLPIYKGKPAIVHRVDDTKEMRYYIDGELVDGDTFKTLSADWVSPNQHAAEARVRLGLPLAKPRDPSTRPDVADSASAAVADGSSSTLDKSIPTRGAENPSMPGASADRDARSRVWLIAGGLAGIVGLIGASLWLFRRLGLGMRP